METIGVVVSKINQLTENIKIFKLKSEKETFLPMFSPGSHIFIKLNTNGTHIYRAYSLINNPWNTDYYEISVLKKEESNGGSKYMHESVMEGDELQISYPVNSFMINKKANKHILIAGGIGITPFSSYLHHFVRYDYNYELHYAFKSTDKVIFHDTFMHNLRNYFYYISNENVHINVLDILANQPSGTQVYVCGPQALIDTVIRTAALLKWQKNNVHFEKFDFIPQGKQFNFYLDKTNKSGYVSGDKTLLVVLEEMDVNIQYGCRVGACGLCATNVLSGEIEHNDIYLNESQKKSKNIILPCVSRGNGKIVLDL
jgi:ferredoxin-NADP reductase